MADTLGAVSLPTAVTTPAGDIALQRVGDFVQAVVNQFCATAWAVVRPREGDDALPIRFVRTHNPEDGGFNDKELPALFVFRSEGNFQQDQDDQRYHESKWTLLWVLHSDSQAKQVLRKTFWNALAGAIDTALCAGISPAWKMVGETDPLASDVAADTDSVKLAAATSVTAQALSGAALNGVRGSSLLSPRLQPTVTTALVSGSDDPGIPDAGDDGPGDLAVYNINEPIVWTVLDWYDRITTKSARLTLPMGGETIGPLEDVKQVISIALPAQLSTLGTISFGTGGFTGRGSDLREVAGLISTTPTGWKRVNVNIEVLDADGRISSRLAYPALQMGLTVREVFTFDLTDTTRFTRLDQAPAGTDIDIVKDELLLTRAEL